MISKASSCSNACDIATGNRLQGFVALVLLLLVQTDLLLFGKELEQLSVKGTVSDSDGRPVPDAIVVMFQGSNRTRVAKSGKDGSFDIQADVWAGATTLSAERIGFAQNEESQTSIKAAVGPVKLVLSRNRRGKKDGQIIVRHSRLDRGGAVTACISTDLNSESVSWTLERLVEKDWVRIAQAKATSDALFEYSYTAEDVIVSFAKFRLTAVVQFKEGSEKLSQTFVASTDITLIGDEP